jgi:hypothetical protein
MKITIVIMLLALAYAVALAPGDQNLHDIDAPFAVVPLVGIANH